MQTTRGNKGKHNVLSTGLANTANVTEVIPSFAVSHLFKALFVLKVLGLKNVFTDAGAETGLSLKTVIKRKTTSIGARLAVITALNHVEFASTSFAHMDLGSFSPILHILPSSVRLDELQRTELPTDFQKRFKSIPGHSSTFKDLSSSHSSVVLAVCLWAFSCRGGKSFQHDSFEHNMWKNS